MEQTASRRSGLRGKQFSARARKNFHVQIPEDVVDRTYRALCIGLDTPVSLGCWLRYKYGEHEQLARKNVEPASYLTAATFKRDYLVTSFLSKYKGLKTGLSTKDEALLAFHNAETSCQQTNRTLREGRLRGLSPREEAVIFAATRKIASLLGSVEKSNWQELCGWGPGVTANLSSRDSTVDRKIGLTPISVTYRARDSLKKVIESDPHWVSAICNADCEGPVSLLPSVFKIMPGGKLTTVPKNAKTDRVILVEPTGNIFLQKGVGGYFRRRLRRVGIDLDNQLTNRSMAELSSLTGEWATIDLKAASDSVCLELVYELLPVEWAMLLDSLRSPKAWIDGKWIELEKFSSMGNGFTFELESLIFWAIAQATTEHLGSQAAVAVYGDDIVVGSEVAPTLIEVLKTVGFSVNLEKTYVDGYFRESCGGHYWSGRDVTPVYQKESVDSLPEVYRLANRLMRLAFKLGAGLWLDRELHGAWCESIRGVNIRHFLPLGEEGDDGLLVPRGEFVQKSSVRLKNWIWQSKTLSYVPTPFPGMERALLAYTLRFHPESPFNGAVRKRRIGTYRTQVRKVLLGTPDVAWL